MTEPAAQEGSEVALVHRLVAGDEDAFAEVVRVHAPRMLATARRLLRDEHEAEDAVQEAFVSAFGALDRFEGASALGTWLHRIAVNAALERLRRRRSRDETSIEELLPQWAADGHHEVSPEPWTLDDGSPAERDETRRVVRAAIDRLPEAHRVALLLRDIEGLTTADAAAALGIDEGTMKVRVHRARLALRNLLAPRFAQGQG